MTGEAIWAPREVVLEGVDKFAGSKDVNRLFFNDIFHKHEWYWSVIVRSKVFRFTFRALLMRWNFNIGLAL